MRNMKKNVLMSAVLATLVTSVALAQSVPQTQMGQISFTGNITDVACKVNGVDYPIGSPITQSVAMGDVPKKFVKSDDASRDKSFSLTFTECNKTPQVVFKNLTSDAPYLKLTAKDDTAKNVGIALFKGTDRILSSAPLNGEVTGDATKNNLAADFKFAARYIPIKDGDQVIPGSANAIADIEVTYQ